MTARLTFAASVLSLAVALVCAAFLLPAEVPLHFDGSGDPDRWGSRTEALVTMGLVGGLLALVLGGSAALVDRMPPGVLNVPHRDWWTATPERERRMRTMMRTDLLVIGAATLLLVALAVVATTVAARSDDPALGPHFVVAFAGYLLFLTGWTVWSLRTRYRRTAP
ncbi:DUF1648 domain-containing protein [Nocardioides dongkuii]|uniref:DUF1648 domain-containing protein n=1 Tax=Nocardioides dongkuii TaxID=2760089 RepID=UPI001878FDA6|nr:DUF1648 domain-containing protein [Nocardioides dongkuii]